MGFQNFGFQNLGFQISAVATVLSANRIVSVGRTA
jgi:hypothetical protein